MFGLGLWFELRNDAANITRFVQGSPAERAGLQKNEQILSINEFYTGVRMMTSFTRIGGVLADVPDGFEQRVADFVRIMPRRIEVWIGQPKIHRR